MLMQRVLTALVLLPLLVAAVWWLPTPALYALFSAVGLLMAWEWSALMHLSTAAPRAGYVVLIGVLLALAWALRAHWVWIAGVSGLWWLIALRLVRGYPQNFARGGPPRPALIAIGAVLIVPTVLSMATLHQQADGALRLLYVFFLIFAADTGAYFAGRRFGRRKLAPAVSPGKSVEGAAGGLLLCAVWALLGGAWIFGARGADLAALAGLSMLVAALSIVGDLTESLFKRAAGVKDSGHILPGHGGILDRVDSLVAAAPVFALGLGLLEL